ncbi:MAG: lpxK [Firmicutes bacterium]|nr:lpxK [Bacillota bacterium]
MRQREALQVYLYQIVYGETGGVMAQIVLLLLKGMSYLYGLAVRTKLGLYKCGLVRQHRLPCRVISLGNITVGGTGKTPTAQLLATAIRDMGYRVVILNRGYRSSWQGQIGLVSDGRRMYMSVNEAGDEAYLLAKNLPGVSVVIGKNRTITGDYAVENLNADVIILDDGYQHWQLARDLDIVLIDAINVFGNNCLLPRGTLREPLRNLNRAGAFLLTKVDQATDDGKDIIKGALAKYNKKALVVESIHNTRYFIEVEDWYKGVRPEKVMLEAAKGHKLLVFSAIGNPGSFEQTIWDLGGEVVATERFPDHHDYTMAEMQAVMQEAQDKNAYALVTTEKDAVKIPSEFIHSDRPLPIYVSVMEVQFIDGQQQLMDLIKQVANKENRK